MMTSTRWKLARFARHARKVAQMPRDRRTISADFDAAWYLSQYRDVAAAGIDPITHYIRYGEAEGRRPRPDFDPVAYLALHDDVRASGINPFSHYVRFGRAEGRLTEYPGDPGGEGQATAAEPVLGFSGLFLPLDLAAGARLDLADLPDTLRGEGFPYLIKAQPVDAAVVLFAEPGQPVPPERIAQACALTSGAVHVISDMVVLDGQEDRVRFHPDGPAALGPLLATVTEGLVCLWHAGMSPSVCTLHLMQAAMRDDPDLFHVGPAVVKPDGTLWRSGFAVSGDCKLRPRAASLHFLEPYEFCLRPAPAIEPMFGLYRTEQLKTALPRSEVNGISVVDRIFALPLTPGKLATQGCAIVMSATEPPMPAVAVPVAVPVAREAIVVVDTVPPMPDQDAGSVTAWNFMEIFQHRGVDVVWYSTGHRKWDNPYALTLCARGVVVLSHPATADFNIACDRVRLAGHGRLTFFLTRVNAGGVYLEDVRKRFPAAKIVFNTVDLHGLRELREARMTGSAALEFLAHSTYARERALIQRSDATILLSDAEMAELSPTLSYANLRLIPMVNEFDPPKAGFDERSGIMFIGSFGHHPNVDAVEYIFDALWDPIRARDPGIKLKIVGPGFPDRLRARLPEGVEVMGFVEDLGAALEQVRLTIAPLRYGAGIKGKIGTSLAHGVPCVGTALATEGMGLKDGREILVADDPEAFADAVLRVHASKKKWTAMSRAGYDFCEARYSRRAVGEKLNALLDEVAA